MFTELNCKCCHEKFYKKGHYHPWGRQNYIFLTYARINSDSCNNTGQGKASNVIKTNLFWTAHNNVSYRV